MPGPSGDLEEWQTPAVNVTRGEAEGDIDLLVCHFSRSPSSPGIICILPDQDQGHIWNSNFLVVYFNLGTC